jgi:hypothetical protein
MSRTVRRKSPDGPRLACFSKKLLLSGIIYGIPDSRVSIVVDEPLAPVERIILSKLVSLSICVGQFNHQNNLGTRCKPNSLSPSLGRSRQGDMKICRHHSGVSTCYCDGGDVHLQELRRV